MTTKQTVEILELLRQDCRMGHKTIATMIGASAEAVVFFEIFIVPPVKLSVIFYIIKYR